MCAMLVAISEFWKPGDTHLGTRLGAAEAIDSGITTVHNWSHMLPSPEFADAELQALADTGIRARFTDETAAAFDSLRKRANWRI